MQVYRLLTEEDDAVFCHKVTEALTKGWELYGSPTYAFDPSTNKMRCGQAVVKEVSDDFVYDRDVKLGAL
ncbi:DUF1737 domain-containing protein [Cohaesibacter gelatinilyticus]|jgi:hypothetical protein|uniref:DUF1737 domain-containing protein n=1 Tax=Cohaesibacter gelatinilyticus TaxID=372072 RepID=A0A285PDC4_9HYPH|nr:DUF1737 domain-containing protein [Cohaesibacter gelatinilyticus]SNZ19740.1 hypothetical protein SAMN06265368_2832 [Cohaesibacter gelatinilyticus]HAT85589.1 DUF1737 domain-containing protein [Hyphomicrobiales bacterium]